MGSTLVRRLLADGHEVNALRRESSTLDLVGETAADVTWITGDLFDHEALAEGMKNASAVFHCAAYLGFEGKKSKEQLYRINVDGTAAIVNAALEHGVGRLVHTSSISALGRSEHSTQCLDESAEWADSPLNTGYGHSKYLAELEVHRGIAEGLDAVMVNPSLIMGPGRAGENTMQIVGQIRDRKLPFCPPGSTNVVDVEDVVDGILLALGKGKTGNRYILSGHNMPWERIIAELAQALGVPAPSRTISRPLLMTGAVLSELAGFVFRFTPLITRETARLSLSMSCYDNTKAINELGFSPRPFSQTAARIAASY